MRAGSRAPMFCAFATTSATTNPDAGPRPPAEMSTGQVPGRLAGRQRGAVADFWIAIINGS